MNWYTVSFMSEPLILVIDPRDDQPVYGQIASQIRSRIATGDILPGTALPSVRALAADLGLNMNTVARAYRLLEDEGFVRIQQRSGAEVAAPARAGSDPERAAGLRDDLATTLARLRQAGVSVAELRRWVERELALLAGRR